MMKEEIKGMIVLAVMMILYCAVCTIQTHDIYNASIVGIDNELITVETSNGCIWQFYGDNYKVGDKVKLYIFNNDTSTYSDDIIENVF